MKLNESTLIVGSKVAARNCQYLGVEISFKFKFQAVQSIYGDRIHITQGNLLLLWKFGFQDRMDRGDRVSNFLSNLGTPEPWNQKSNEFLINQTFKF